MNTLSQDLNRYLTEYLCDNDIPTICLSNKHMNNEFKQSFEDKSRRCRCRAESRYYGMACNLKENLDYYIKLNNSKGIYEFQLTKEKEVKCKMHPDNYHTVKVYYHHSNRAMDCISWYLDGEYKGYTFF